MLVNEVLLFPGVFQWPACRPSSSMPAWWRPGTASTRSWWRPLSRMTASPSSKEGGFPNLVRIINSMTDWLIGSEPLHCHAWKQSKLKRRWVSVSCQSFEHYLAFPCDWLIGSDSYPKICNWALKDVSYRSADQNLLRIRLFRMFGSGSFFVILFSKKTKLFSL